jgi:predicted DNA-binding protein (MmcQ/YjbR family)
VLSPQAPGRPDPGPLSVAGRAGARPLGVYPSAVDNMARLEAIVARLPEAERVDVEAWDGHPTFRVNNKNFVFASNEVDSLSVKLTKEEAAAVVATDDHVEPTGYGLGRHGWIQVTVPKRAGRERWDLIEEWVRTSYTLIAPKRLAKVVLAEDQERG